MDIERGYRQGSEFIGGVLTLYITHKKANGEYQKLLDHLLGVAELAKQFAAPFDAGEHAYRTGLLHDVGKYSPAAQRRQNDPEHTSLVDHSTAGAQVAQNLYHDTSAAAAIAGHHGGLLNCGSRACEDGTLMGRLQKKLDGPLDSSAWKTEVFPQQQMYMPSWLHSLSKKKGLYSLSVYIRMLFSCLVDADYLDTEAFMSDGKTERAVSLPLSALMERLQQHVQPWLDSASSALNMKRNELLRRCMKGDELSKGLYTMTIPTGGGKTVASLAFALSHAIQHGLTRIIYVVPYTSIIEQNAQCFREIVGEEAVLEHHSNINFDDTDEKSMRLAAENWDAPIIVTTAVQFFESLYSNQTSRCRKLHNISNSVIIFDEAQMLPVPYLRPCVNMIAELVERYGSTAVLCTATQPALDGLIANYAPELACKEITENTGELYTFFRRTQFCCEGVFSEEALVENLLRSQQVLCIVNSRKRANELYQMLGQQGRFHLSTLMTPEHRSRTLKKIKERLNKGLVCRVISTSLIEAGVDLDFPTVWREEAGLDSVLQAAGRCNREGKRPLEESLVHVFRFGERPPKMFMQNITALNKVLDRFEDIATPEAIAYYFRQLLFMVGEDALDTNGIVDKCTRLAFRDVKESFRIIDDETIPVYIPTVNNAHLLQALRDQTISRYGLRELGRDVVNVYSQHFEMLRGYMYCSKDDSFGILQDADWYDEECGLLLEPSTGMKWFP